MRVVTIGDRKICIAGIGKLFYQDGYPISMAVSEMGKKGIEVSILHVADECLKNGWSAKTTYNKLISDFDTDIDKNKIDKDHLKLFLNSDYEAQREMIFEYLFGCSTNDVRSGKNREPIDFIKSIL